MRTSSPASLFLLITALIGVCQGYFRMNCGIVQTGRLDPVVSPGKINGHVHKVSGASSTYHPMLFHGNFPPFSVTPRIPHVLRSILLTANVIFMTKH